MRGRFPTAESKGKGTEGYEIEIVEPRLTMDLYPNWPAYPRYTPSAIPLQPESRNTPTSVPSAKLAGLWVTTLEQEEYQVSTSRMYKSIYSENPGSRWAEGELNL
jgi:hypothetical protein